jgi:CubicO group peptidase (beta-lactamase class C family)
MNDSGFLLRPAQRSRLASVHERQPDGSLTVSEFEMTQQPEFFMGGGGLYSTGSDYLRFLRMLLGGGQLDGARVLRSETVAEMGRNQIGDLALGKITTVLPADSNDFEFFPGLEKKWGIDPGKRVTGVLLTQILPFADPDVLELLARFERGIYAGLAARGPRAN